MAYVGQTRCACPATHRKGCVRGRLAAFRYDGGRVLGECTQRNELPPRRTPWFLDNGAFRDWLNGKPFDTARWADAIAAARAFPTPPDFVVAPDLVAGGWASLEVSVESVGALAGLRPYLVAQDGMEADVDRVACTVTDHGFAGLFVGGSLPWKRATAGVFTGLARRLGVPCHIGRVGNLQRVRWARELGATSIDSSAPLWDERGLRAFFGALQETDQSMLFNNPADEA